MVERRQNVGLMLSNLNTKIGFLSVAPDGTRMENRIFGLDAQLLVDTVILAISVFVLFLVLSYLLFNPARALLQKRRDKIREEMEHSLKDKEKAMQFKEEYESKLKAASLKVDEILSEGRKRAIAKENQIINEAQEEALRVRERASREIELEKSKLKEDVKQEMISVAFLMASKIIGQTIDESKQNQLVEETLNEIGDHTWQS